MPKIIEVADDSSVVENFSEFCDLHDIAVMDRAELFYIFKHSGPGYALRRWHQMQVECEFGRRAVSRSHF